MHFALRTHVASSWACAATAGSKPVRPAAGAGARPVSYAGVRRNCEAAHFLRKEAEVTYVSAGSMATCWSSGSSVPVTSYCDRETEVVLAQRSLRSCYQKSALVAA